MEVKFLSIVNVFLASGLVAIMVIGIVLNLRYSPRNVYRHYLVMMLAFWALVMTAVFAHFHVNGYMSLAHNNDVLGMPVLLLGIPCFLSLVSYPLMVLSPSLLRPKYWVRILMPMLVAVVAYFVSCAAAGEEPFQKYGSMAEIVANISMVSVYMRLVLVVMFMVYVVVIFYHIWHIVPLYNKYVLDNIADSDSNADWVRLTVIHMIVVSLCYFAMLASNSIVINFIYILSLIFLFSSVVEKSLFSNTSDDIESLNIRWSKQEGWYVSSQINDISRRFVGSNELANIEKRLDEWMVNKKPYANTDFTTSDIIRRFPDITSTDLLNLFKSLDETFQSYVRRYRIEEACRIIEQSNYIVYPKQIFSKVGFSYYSSFSRSFMAVKGKTPSEYIDEIIALRDSQLLDNEQNPPPPRVTRRKSTQ